MFRKASLPFISVSPRVSLTPTNVGSTRMFPDASRVSVLIKRFLGVQVRFAFRRAFARTTPSFRMIAGQGDFCGFSGFDEVSVFGLHVWIEASGDDVAGM